MRYYLIAGEPSGDLHGANLMKGLKAHDPEAKFRFWGGDKMAGVGGSGNLAKHYKETSFFGIVEVIKNLRTIRRQMKECRQDVEAFAPDVLILVDYPGFNMKMARWAKEHGIRVFYYIAPKVWAWREWRVKAIRKYVDELFIIFPFERDYFPKHGIRPIFEGNPLVDAIEARRASLPSPDEFRRRHALDERPIVALLAGSRRSEIKANLPLIPADTIEAYLPEEENPCTVTYDGGKTVRESLYDPSYLEGRDKYAYFLGGNHPLTEITTSVRNGRRLLVIKDSYAHALVPFLTAHYETIDMVDLRYFKEDLAAWMGDRGITDVLVLYNASTFASDRQLAAALS